MIPNSIDRPNRVTVDTAAFAHNLALLRHLLPAGTEIWQVCKGDGYGLGTGLAATLGDSCGIRQFCVGTPEEAVDLRNRHPDPNTQILLFPAALPEGLPALARHRVTLSVHNTHSLDAVLTGAPGAAFFFKVDTGLHRYGFDIGDWPSVLDTYAEAGHGGLKGIYTHFGQAQAGQTAKALHLYDRFCSIACSRLGYEVPRLVAASHALFAHPDLPYERVDPGRALYGMLPPRETGGLALRPVVTSITSRLIECREIEPDSIPIGYGGTTRLEGGGRIGVFPIGHFDGLPSGGALGTVLIRGKEAPVLARTLLSSIVDISGIEGAVANDEVVLAGRSQDRERDIFALAENLQTSVTLLHFGLIQRLPKSLVG